MAKELQFRRGTTAQHATFVGAEGEITVDTDKDVVVVHDGTTAGGFPLARESEVVSSIESTPNTLVRRDPYNGIWAGTGTFSDLVIFSDPITDLGGTLILTGHNDSHMMVSNDSGTLVIGDGTGDLLKVAGGTGVVSAKDIHAPHIHLTSTDGSAPFSVSSSVKVTNLNADLLDGMYATTAVVPDTLVVRDGNACLSGKGFVVDNGLADGGNVQFLSAGNTSINIDNSGGTLRVVDSDELFTVTSDTGDIWSKGSATLDGGVFAPFAELGSSDTTPCIDFHSGASVTDYDSRIIAYGGTSSSGHGSLVYYANGGHTFEGPVNASELNLSGQAGTTTAATHYFVETGADGLVRPKTLENVKTEIGTSLNLSEIPTAPTATADTSTEQLATTAFATPRTGTTGASVIPAGTTAQRPDFPVDGYLRYNTELLFMEGYINGAWGSVGGVPVTDDIFRLNDQVITANYTIPTGKNAGTFGPITINTGVVVTIPTGSTWTII